MIRHLSRQDKVWNITDLSSQSTPQVCPEKLRKSGCISEEEVFAVTMLKISSYLLSHFHFSVTIFLLWIERISISQSIRKPNKYHHLLQHLFRPQYPEHFIGGNNEEPPAGLDPAAGEVQCVQMGLLQVPSNEVRIASDESKILGW